MSTDFAKDDPHDLSFFDEILSETGWEEEIRAHDLFIGIDVGSLSTDGVVINRKPEIVRAVVFPTGASISKTIDACEYQLYEELETDGYHVQLTVATGYGRKRVDSAKETITEITAHALGARMQFPDARTVIDIGGQDTKVISLSPEGAVSNFVMNDKCAAGTGRFLEVMARILEMDLEEMAEAALSAERTIPLTSTCTVFIESEIISSIAEGIPPNVIAASAYKAIAERISAMVREAGGISPFVLTGGVAKNRAMVAALTRIITGTVYVPDDPQIIGALGAALYGLRKS